MLRLQAQLTGQEPVQCVQAVFLVCDPLLNIGEPHPYSQEINDIPAIAVRRAGSAEFADMIIDQFDEMCEQARSQPLALGIALHPYIVGQPFRLRQLRRALTHIASRRDSIWLTYPGAIAEAFARQVPFEARC